MTIFARDPDTGDRQMGLPDDAARRMGLRRHQRDDPGRHHTSRASRSRRSSTSTATGSPTRSTARPASCWWPRSSIRRSTGPRTSTCRPAGPKSSKSTAPRPTARTRTPRHLPGGARLEGPAAGAFSPKTGLFYVPTNHVCMDYEPFKVSYTAGQPYVGATLSMYPPQGAGEPRQFHRLGRRRRQDRVVRSRSRSRSGRARSRRRATSSSTARSKAT